jgi:zinc transporter 12
VEEMQTQDFLNSATSSPDLCVDTSVIVKLEENSKTCSVYITFAVGNRKANFTVEAPAEHPFYVYHRGWSSCSPEGTLNRYGLECHKLKQGDTCISLTKKPKDKLVSPSS